MKLLANQYPPLNGVRLLGILAVVQVHLTKALTKAGLVTSETLRARSMDLYFGMDAFFVLSGFLIGTILLSETTTGPPGVIRRFYLRRLFRTVPVYVVVLTMLALFTESSAPQRANLWKEYVYLTNYIPPLEDRTVMPWGWSLAVEEQFYLAAPVLVFAVRSVRSLRAQLTMLAAAWASALGVRLVVYYLYGPWTAISFLSTFYTETHLRYDILIAGFFVACLQRRHQPALVAFFSRRWARRAALALSSVAFVAIFLIGSGLDCPPLASIFAWGTLTSFAYVPLFLYLLNHTGLLSRVLSHPIFAYGSALGYGIYLVHVPVISWMVVPLVRFVARLGSTETAWVIGLCLSLMLSAAVSYMLHVTIEKPSLLLRDRYAARH